jgi:hypothetical protein
VNHILRIIDRAPLIHEAAFYALADCVFAVDLFASSSIAGKDFGTVSVFAGGSVPVCKECANISIALPVLAGTMMVAVINPC